MNRTPDLTIVDYFGYNLSPQERMHHIKAAGFHGVILLWADYFDKDYKDFPKYAKDVGLYVENAHAPYVHANHLWEAGHKGQEYVEEIITCIKDCSHYGIPTLVMHPENKVGNQEVALPADFSIGIGRLKEIVAVAEAYGVNIAMENMSRHEFLDCIFGQITSDRLGFCFDSGHWHLFMPQVDLLGLYGDKLMALHLHDNNGVDDWHALPGGGSIDWGGVMGKLKQLNYAGPIALEVGNAQFEDIPAPGEFLKVAVAKAKKLRE